jgi:Inner membrane component of T3SS, cytoplasmic domain
VLRVEIVDAGQGALPAIDVADATFVIGSSPEARVRLPAAVAEAAHITISDGTWRSVDGTSGAIGTGITLELGAYRIVIAPAPAGSMASPPQRTESLARELMRSLLGTSAAPTLEVERGPSPGATRKLSPPESALVIGRGDEANWILLDEDLSRTHAEVRRGWDGTRVFDLSSKNGTRIDGTPVGAAGAPLRDGQLLELGKVALRFRDPADASLAAPSGTAVATPSARHRAIEASPPSTVTAPVTVTPPVAGPPPRASTAPFVIAVSIMAAALVGLVWVLSL